MNELIGAIPAVLDRLAWMRQQRLWPNGLRYLWTDAFGVTNPAMNMTVRRSPT